MAPNQLRHGLDVDAAVDTIGRSHDLHAEARPEREKLDLVGCVVIARRQDHVIALEWNRRERLHRGGGRVLRKRDVARRCSDQRGDRSV